MTDLQQVSIRAPRAGGDSRWPSITSAMTCFNPRPPCGRRPEGDGSPHLSTGFNPRPPCGRRLVRRRKIPPMPTFQSAPPVREATGVGRRRGDGRSVSIRAPRAGGDGSRLKTLGRLACFNPRPPCGRRPDSGDGSTNGNGFQSAPPVREATCARLHLGQQRRVSIRAPRAGGDLQRAAPRA